MLKRFLLISLFSTPCLAVPVLSGGLSGNGGVFVPLGGDMFTNTVTRVGVINPANNIASVAGAAGLTATDLNGLPGGPSTRVGIVTGTFTGGVLNDGIRFTASATDFTLNTSATPSFAYFAALDDLTGANPTLFLPLNLTSAAQTFEFLLPAAGNYQFSIGALRTNQNPGTFGSYGTTLTVNQLAGFGTPEVDPSTSALPLLFCSALLLTLKRRSESQAA